MLVVVEYLKKEYVPITKVKNVSIISGKKMKDKYKEYVDLTNKAAVLNGFKDGTEMKTHSYESDTFVEEMAQTWSGLKVQ